jgi:hypothetical protein
MRLSCYAREDRGGCFAKPGATLHAHHLDRLRIIIAYLLRLSLIGLLLKKRASKNINSYLLGGNELPWYYLGLSNASGTFDISGTMWLVTLMFVYGLKTFGCRGSGPCSIASNREAAAMNYASGKYSVQRSARASAIHAKT